MRNYLFLILLLNPFFGFSFDSRINFKGEKLLIIDNIGIVKDAENKISAIDIFKNPTAFKFQQGQLNLDHTDEVIWTYFEVSNQQNDSNLCIRIDHPLLDSISLFTLNYDGTITEIKCNILDDFDKRPYPSVMIILPFQLQKGEVKKMVMRFRSTEQMILPVQIDKISNVRSYSNTRDIIYGIFLGIVMVMLF
ncbi:MAG: 7TM-DISM domain-containing protein, partial [Bacteroidia bacterium]